MAKLIPGLIPPETPLPIPTKKAVDEWPESTSGELCASNDDPNTQSHRIALAIGPSARALRIMPTVIAHRKVAHLSAKHDVMSFRTRRAKISITHRPFKYPPRGSLPPNLFSNLVEDRTFARPDKVGNEVGLASAFDGQEVSRRNSDQAALTWRIRLPELP